jgi:hypothetical protein
VKRKFLLLKGEGQDEGKEKTSFVFKNLTPSPARPGYTQGSSRRGGESAVALASGQNGNSDFEIGSNKTRKSRWIDQVLLRVAK